LQGTEADGVADAMIEAEFWKRSLVAERYDSFTQAVSV
jgi:hypothetical protein